MTYAVIDSRHADTEERYEASARRIPEDRYNAFGLYLRRLGHAEFIGVVDTALGRAFHFDPRYAQRGLKELRWKDGKWVKP